MKLDTSTDPQVGFRPPGALDISTALQRYDGPFTRRHAAHLLRRSGFGGTSTEVDALASMSPSDAVDTLLHPREPDVDLPDFPNPDSIFNDKTRYQAGQNWWLDRMLRTKHPLFEKMVLFWHGHFANSQQKVLPHLMVAQLDMFRSLGMGKFEPLLLAVSKDPAMLIFLDNRFNVKAHPNENYAREIMELFALGLGNYTEDDIKNAARAFTGWTLDRNQAFVFRPNLHDDGPKTIFGHTGNFAGEDVVALIVQQPSHSRFIARKLLEFFVYSDPEPELIEALAQTYALSGLDIGQTVGTILRSNVFFSTRAYRAIPKSPIEFVIGLLRFMQVQTLPPDTLGWLIRMGQNPLAPPSVKGWDGGPTWINTATLLTRFNYVNRLTRAAPPAQRPQAVAPQGTQTGTQAMMMAPSPAPVDYSVFPALTPDLIVQNAGGMDTAKILSSIVSGAIQDDVTSDVRVQLMDYLQATSAPLPVPFGPENYQDRIRGALALTLNLPSNQLD